MKKMLSLGIAALVLSAAVATPALADDRLALSGEMRVRGFTADTVELGEQKNEFFDQRFRLGGKLTVADGVFVNFRFDATETQWGSDDTLGKDTARLGTTLQWDKVNLELDQESFNLVAGQQWFGTGNAIVVDNIGTGFTYTAKLATPITLTYNKLHEGGELTDLSGTKDADLFTVAIAREGQGYSASLFFARLVDEQGDYVNTDGDLTYTSAFLPALGIDKAKINAVGLTYDTTLGAIALKAELDYIFGDLYVGAAEGDAVGTQLYLDASTAMSDTANVGLMAFYAMGAGDDDELQFTQLSDWQDWDPTTYGYLNCDYSILPQNTYEVFDFTGQNAGVIGAQVYGDFQVMEGLGVMASAFYLMPEEDNNTLVDETMGGNLSAEYTIVENTTLAGQASYSTTGYSDNTDDLDQWVLGARLAVAF